MLHTGSFEIGNTGRPHSSFFSTRYIVIIITFFAFNLSFISRNSLGVAFVKMVNPLHHQPDRNNSRLLVNFTRSNISTEYEFNWDEQMQGNILCCFGSTFGVGGLFGGRLSEMFGTKKIIGGSVFILSVLSLILPTAARESVTALILVRLVQGFMAGMVMPSMNTVVSRWMPKSERSVGLSLLLGATRLGFVIGSLVTGFLCKLTFLNGWPLSFYIFGTLGIIWTVVWTFVMYETPQKHPRISQKELEYILKNQGEEKAKAKKNVKIPYRAIFTSLPVWATLFANIGESWGTSTIPINLPLYFSHILDYDVAESGFLVAMTSLLQCVIMWCSGAVFDVVMKVTKINKSFARKIMNSMGQIVPAFCLVAATLVGYNRTANVVLFILTLGLNGFIGSGFRAAVVDMAPDFAGTVMGVTVFVANNLAFISPVVVGLLTNNNQTLQQWHIVFWINAGVYFFCGVCFLIGGSSELQPWGLAKENEDETQERTFSNTRMTTINDSGKPASNVTVISYNVI